MRGFAVDSGRTVADSPQALCLTPHFLFTPLFSPPSQRLTGKVKFYHRRKGYGFIIPIDAANETNGVFVHRTSIYKRDLVFPDEGEVVTYEITNDESGRPKAVNVERPDAKPYTPAPRAPRPAKKEGEEGAAPADGEKKKRKPRRRGPPKNKDAAAPAAEQA